MLSSVVPYLVLEEIQAHGHQRAVQAGFLARKMEMKAVTEPADAARTWSPST